MINNLLLHYSNFLSGQVQTLKKKFKFKLCMAVRKPSIETKSNRNSFSWLWCVVSIESCLGRKVTEAWYGFCKKQWRQFHFLRDWSVQFSMVSMRSENPICAPPRLSQKFLQRCLWNSSNSRLIDDCPISSFFRDCLNENCAVAVFYFRPYTMDCMRLCRLSTNYCAVEMTAIINSIIIITSVITFKHRK